MHTQVSQALLHTVLQGKGFPTGKTTPLGTVYHQHTDTHTHPISRFRSGGEGGGWTGTLSMSTFIAFFVFSPGVGNEFLNLGPHSSLSLFGSS